MKFYNRKAELEALEALYRGAPSFVVLTGKRRVGKTEIIKQFIKGKKAVYLYADSNKSDGILLAEFEAQIKVALGVEDYVRFGTFREMLEFLLSFPERIVVAIDEFQRFPDIYPAFITELQRLWDLRGGESNLMLVASGSSVGMMKKIFIEKRAPLFKRADNIMTIRPFTLAEIFRVMDDLGVKGVREKFEIYCLFGGTIHYYKLMEKYGVRSLEDALDKLILSDFAPLKNEVKDVLVEEFGREHPTYYEILSAMAIGKASKTEIGDTTHIAANSLSPYFRDLIEILGAVEYDIPATDTPGKTKKGRYMLRDNFFRFYFRFIYRDMSQYQFGNYGAIRKKIDAEWNDFMGRAFEDVALEYARKELGNEYRSIGRYWDRKGNEFDIVGIDRKTGKMFLGEVKLRGLRGREISQLVVQMREKSRIIPFKAKNIRYGVFSMSVQKDAKSDGSEYSVWTLDDMINDAG